MKRIVSATEQLLNRQPFELITVRTIVTKARTSIGSFYSRFHDKRALLPLLYARYESSLAAHLDKLNRSLNAPRQTLNSSAELIVRHFVWLYGRRPHLMRSLAEYARRDTAAHDQLTPMRRRAQHEFMCHALLNGAHAMRRPASSRTAETALFVVDAACRERLLYPTAAHSQAVGLDEGELVEELVRLLVAAMTSEPTSRTKIERIE